MRLAGATRAQARGVTDGRIGSDGWLGGFSIFSQTLISPQNPIGQSHPATRDGTPDAK